MQPECARGKDDKSHQQRQPSERKVNETLMRIWIDGRATAKKLQLNKECHKCKWHAMNFQSYCNHLLACKELIHTNINLQTCKHGERCLAIVWNRKTSIRIKYIKIRSCNVISPTSLHDISWKPFVGIFDVILCVLCTYRRLLSNLFQYAANILFSKHKKTRRAQTLGQSLINLVRWQLLWLNCA